jgi:hypothetical protein
MRFGWLARTALFFLWFFRCPKINHREHRVPQRKIHRGTTKAYHRIPLWLFSGFLSALCGEAFELALHTC